MKSFKFKGLGDVVEAVTTVTGVKAVTEAAAKAIGKDCGCKARKERLNEAYPIGRRKP